MPWLFHRIRTHMNGLRIWDRIVMYGLSPALSVLSGLNLFLEKPLFSFHMTGFYFWILLLFVVFGEALVTFATDTEQGRNRIFFSKMLLSAVLTTLTYASAYRVLGLSNGETVVHDPVISLYFSIITWTTVGYGDFYPTAEGRLIAATEGLLGYVYMAVIVGVTLHLLQERRHR